MVAFDSEHVLHLKYNFVMNFNHRALAVARRVIPLLLFLAALCSLLPGLIYYAECYLT
jgi:hypothetical protein